MKMLRAWLKRFTGLFSNDSREQEFDLELESNLQLHIDDNLSAGMSPEEARRKAILKLGGLEPTRQAYRERGTLPSFETVLQDLRFAFRQLFKNPGFAVTAILVLSIGIAASTAIFGFVDAALIKPLPYKDTGRLLAVTEKAPLFPRANISYPDFVDWKKMNNVFSSFDVYTGSGYLLSGSAGTEMVNGSRVSSGFFHTLGVTPILGRDFYSGEDVPNGQKTVIVTYGAWQKRLGGRKDVIGQVVSLSGIPYTVVGVLPQGFHFAPRGRAEFWVPLQAVGECETRRSCHNLDGVARLKDGVSIETARAQMESIAAQLEKQYPDANRGQGASVLPLAEIITGNLRPILFTLFAGAILLLAIACVNVASLLLVRSEGRRREIAVRGALGASRLRLIRQFITEGSLLVAIAAVIGIVSAQLAMELLTHLIPAEMMAYVPYLQNLRINLHSMLFALAISVFTLLLFSVTPVLHAPANQLREGLAEGSRGSSHSWRRFGAQFVVVELAIAVVLLVGAGLLGQSLYRLLRVDLGFEPDHLATFDIAIPEHSYPKDPQVAALLRQIVARISKMPGVQSASVTSMLPVTFNGNTDWIRFVGRPYDGQHIEVNQRDVSPNYFTTLHARLLRGHYFTEEEDASKPLVVIINESLAKKYFPNEDPIGKQFGDTSLTPKSIKQIVGVVNDVKEGSLDSEIVPAIYFPINQNLDTYVSLIVRTSQPEGPMLPSLVAAVHEIDRGLGIVGETTMPLRIDDSQTAYLHRSAAWLVAGFAILALLLGTIGLYGVISYSVSQRTREIGVRMALGAQRGTVYQLVLSEAARLAVLGITAGILCSLAATTLLQSILFGVHSWDIATFASVAVVLGSAALLASYIPAHRAASINPVEALRAE
jgi:macrolide transport system ATP-binding/permease protein